MLRGWWRDGSAQRASILSLWLRRCPSRGGGPAVLAPTGIRGQLEQEGFVLKVFPLRGTEQGRHTSGGALLCVSSPWRSLLQGAGLRSPARCLEHPAAALLHCEVINGHNPSRQGLKEMRLQKCTVRTWEQLSWLLTGLRSLNKRVWKEKKKAFMRN